MAYRFTASRVGSGDVVFPDEIIIDYDEQILVYRKPSLRGYQSTTIRFAAIGSVSVSNGLMFRDVIIETNGGNTIRAKGFSIFDAERIAKLLS